MNPEKTRISKLLEPFFATLIDENAIFDSALKICESTPNHSFSLYFVSMVKIDDLFKNVFRLNDTETKGKCILLMLRILYNLSINQALSSCTFNDDLLETLTSLCRDYNLLKSHDKNYMTIIAYAKLLLDSYSILPSKSNIIAFFAEIFEISSNNQDSDDYYLLPLIDFVKSLPTSEAFPDLIKVSQPCVSLLDAVFASGELSKQKISSDNSEVTQSIGITDKNIFYLAKLWADSIYTSPKKSWIQSTTLHTPDESNPTFLTDSAIENAHILISSKFEQHTITLQELHRSTSLLSAFASLLSCCDAEQKFKLSSGGYLASLIYCMLRGMAAVEHLEIEEGKISLKHGWASDLGLDVIDDEGNVIDTDRLLIASETLNIDQNSEIYQKATERAGKDAHLLGPGVGYRRDLIRAITALCWMNPWGIDFLIEAGGIKLITAHLVHDNTNPLLREWALASIKTLAFKNPRMAQELRKIDLEIDINI